MRRTGMAAVAALVALAAAACTGEPSDPEVPVQATAQPTALAAAALAPPAPEGKALYEVHCIGCHGVGGLGDGPLAATLPVQPANLLEHLGVHSDEGMALIIAEGIPPVMPPAAIGTDQILQVLDYVWSIVPDSTRGRLRAAQFIMMEEAH